jgi:hypothetical protein
MHRGATGSVLARRPLATQYQSCRCPGPGPGVCVCCRRDMKCDVRWGARAAIGPPKVGNSRRWTAQGGANRFGDDETRQDGGGRDRGLLKMTGPRGRGVMCNVRARQQGRAGSEGRPLGRLAYPRFLEQEKSCSGATGAGRAAQGALHETDCNQKVLNCCKKRRWLRCCWEPGWEPRHSASISPPRHHRRPDPACLPCPDSTSETLEPTPSKPPALLRPSWFAGT